MKSGQVKQTPTGIEVTFVGQGHDDFDDGRFDDWVALRFRRGNEKAERMVSVYGEHQAEELLGACWILDSARGDEIVITFFPKTP